MEINVNASQISISKDIQRKNLYAKILLKISQINLSWYILPNENAVSH